MAEQQPARALSLRQHPERQRTTDLSTPRNCRTTSMIDHVEAQQLGQQRHWRCQRTEPVGLQPRRVVRRRAPSRAGWDHRTRTAGRARGRPRCAAASARSSPTPPPSPEPAPRPGHGRGGRAARTHRPGRRTTRHLRPPYRSRPALPGGRGRPLGWPAAPAAPPSRAAGPPPSRSGTRGSRARRRGRRAGRRHPVRSRRGAAVAPATR